MPPLLEHDAEGRPRLLRDPYMEWAQDEGVPIHEGYGIDLLNIETAPLNLL
jgi:hypothetical protein